MNFRNQEKQRYEKLKPVLFSKEAQPSGKYKSRNYPFCLADGYSHENLHESFRDDAIEYFKFRDIPWHDGHKDSGGNKNVLPSNHLCCSQTMCVNTLFPMALDKKLLERVFRIYFPEMKKALPITNDKPFPDGSIPYISFEFVGDTHFEGEKGWPQRGANCTSLDFALLFERYDGKKQLVLGEWKYTEEYKSHKLPPKDKINQTRFSTYHKDYGKWRKSNSNAPSYKNYFVEPFYQLMRQSVLAHKMESGNELDADVVVHLHISPKANEDFSDAFTSSTFAKKGNTVLEAWKCTAQKHKFMSVHSESLLTTIEQVAGRKYKDWSKWLLKRYGWWRKK